MKLTLAVLPSLWLSRENILDYCDTKKDEGRVMLLVKWILLIPFWRTDKRLARICCKAALILKAQQAHM